MVKLSCKKCGVITDSVDDPDCLRDFGRQSICKSCRFPYKLIGTAAKGVRLPDVEPMTGLSR